MESNLAQLVKPMIRVPYEDDLMKIKSNTI
jgi:hypothetical protein